jgi:flagellar motility protein MotE (MotC chaperone)
VKLRPRLIPSVILAATVLLGLKVSDIFSVGSLALAQAPSQATGAPIDLTSLANAAKAPDPIATAGKPQNAPAAIQSPPIQAAPQPAATQPATAPQQATPPRPATAPQPATVPQQQPATPQKQASAPQAPAQPAEAAKPALPAADGKPETQTAEAPAALAAAPDAKSATKDPLLLSPAEIEVLQELSARRAQLDRRAGEIDQQQVVLQAAEKRIDEKIAKLEAIQKSVQATVDKQNAADDARTQSLVKIYETMKPADAAQILGQLDMPILLQMLSRMKEAKTAPILAAMDPTKAEAITTAMAKRQNPPSVPPVPAPAPAKP